MEFLERYVGDLTLVFGPFDCIIYIYIYSIHIIYLVIIINLLVKLEILVSFWEIATSNIMSFTGD